MLLFLKRAVIFLIIALLIAFVLIPLYDIIAGRVPFDFIKQRIINNINFIAFDIWKQVFIFYLALWCGKAILWALATASIKK